MQWIRENRAIRDHVKNEKILLLFKTEEKTKEKTKGRIRQKAAKQTGKETGDRRFVGPMTYVGYEEADLPDVNGQMQKGIIFKLAGSPPPTAEAPDALGFMRSRQGALDASKETAPVVKTAQERRQRSRQVARYVQERAVGFCEICGHPAPFETKDEKPYLESHHIIQVADDGPDAPKDVAAACPTCHRRVHYAAEGKELNKAAHKRVQRVEAAIEGNYLKLVTAALIFDGEGRVLIAQRKDGRELGAKWEFPGGKVEAGENLEECLKRELKEEFGVTVASAKRFFMVDHTYPTFDIRLCAMLVSGLEGALEPNDHEQIAWVKPQDLETYDLAPADEEIRGILL